MVNHDKKPRQSPRDKSWLLDYATLIQVPPFAVEIDDSLGDVSPSINKQIRLSYKWNRCFVYRQGTSSMELYSALQNKGSISSYLKRITFQVRLEAYRNLYENTDQSNLQFL